MKYLYIFAITLILICSPIAAASLVEIENYLDQMLTYQLEFDEQAPKLTEAIEYIDNELAKSEDDAYLWYLKGRSSFAALYVFGKQDDRYVNFRQSIPVDYDRALSLNRSSSRLREDQLYRILTKALATNISIEATRQYLALMKSQGWTNHKEYLLLSWERLILPLIRLNKFDEASEELAKLEATFPEKQLAYVDGTLWRTYLNEKLEEYEQKLAGEAAAENQSAE